MIVECTKKQIVYIYIYTHICIQTHMFWWTEIRISRERRTIFAHTVNKELRVTHGYESIDIVDDSVSREENSLIGQKYKHFSSRFINQEPDISEGAVTSNCHLEKTTEVAGGCRRSRSGSPKLSALFSVHLTAIWPRSFSDKTSDSKAIVKEVGCYFPLALFLFRPHKNCWKSSWCYCTYFTGEGKEVREVKELAQINTGYEWWHQNWNPDLRGFKALILYFPVLQSLTMLRRITVDLALKVPNLNLNFCIRTRGAASRPLIEIKSWGLTLPPQI